VNHKHVERLWRREGLKVPAKQPKRSRLWLNDPERAQGVGSCLRLKPEFPNHVWSYDFVLQRTHAGRAFRILNVIDEYTRECLAVKVQRHLDHEDVQECLTELFCERGVPLHLRSDNGPEFIANALRDCLNKLSVKPLFIEPGSPWENGYVESFKGKVPESGLFCDHELLDREIFYTLPSTASLAVILGHAAWANLRSGTTNAGWSGYCCGRRRSGSEHRVWK